MADTTLMQCEKRKEETDCINGLCYECSVGGFVAKVLGIKI